MSVENLRYISSEYNKGNVGRTGAIVRILGYNGIMQKGGIKSHNNTVFHDIAQVIAAKEIKRAYGGKKDPILELEKQILFIKI